MPTQIRMRPTRVPPKNMTDADWARFLSEGLAEFYRGGQTDFDEGVGFWIGVDVDGIFKLSFGDSAGNKVTWDGFDLSIVGNLVLAIGNFIRSGQTAYNTGVGWWLGNDGGIPKFSIGDPAGNNLTWDGTDLSGTGSLRFSNNVSTFTPTWTGFSSAPIGDISYIDFGVYVVMFIAGTDLTGTSDTTAMSITNIPSAIQPSAARNIASCSLADNGVITHIGGADLNGATLTFGLHVTNVVANRVTRSNTAFTAASSKGLAGGWFILYAK